MNDLPGMVERLYHHILRAYPPEYLETFGDEMQNTFLEGLEDANAQGQLTAFILHEMLDTPKFLAGAYWDRWSQKVFDGIELLQKATTSADLPPAPPDGRDSWCQYLLEVSMFLVTGILMLLATYLPIKGLLPGWERNAEFLGRIIIPFTVPLLLIGLARGLPRWSYPLGGLLLSYSGLIARQTSLWLFLVLMLLATSTLVAVAVLTDPQPSRLPVPIRRIGQSLSISWTRLSFGIFGAIPIIILMAFDDAQTNSRTPFFAFSVLAMILGALVYCRSRNTNTQLAVLLAGLTFSIWGGWLDTVSFGNGLATWTAVTGSGYGSFGWMAVLWIQWAIFITSPVIFIWFEKVIRLKRIV